jgi:hypothetical protein
MAELGLQEAVRRAREILTELYPDEELKHVLLEEIERDRSGTWYVTLGFARPGTLAGLAGLPSASSAQRAYKQIKINAKTGEFQGMRDRLLEETLRS